MTQAGTPGPPLRRPRARAARRVIGAALVVAAAGLGAWLVGSAARVLVATDPLPAHADAIVVLSGSTSDRVLEAARLWHAGIAPRVVLGREQLPPGGAALRARGVRLPESHELAQQALVALGVPADAIRVLWKRARSTRTEANILGRWACATGVRSLVVVTSPSHTRRARLLLRDALGPRIALAVRPARDRAFSTRRWWRNRRAAKDVLSEWQKLAHYWLRERWSMRPCGGLPRRQRLAAATRRSGASSPRACISRTMSQPPMNFPPTNTCGIVGQLVKAFTASRFSASARTSTALKGRPISCRTSTVAAEKPHMGKRGVPFM